MRCFLADNHAETFTWISRNIELDQPHVLILVDAHSDASAAERSEELRESLRRVADERERARRVDEWRKAGRVQAYNWIEPLMPRPVAQVRWICGVEVSQTERHDRWRQAVASLDGRLEVEPRSAGSFAERFHCEDFSELDEAVAEPVILALDLDFFVGMDVPTREKHFSALWRTAMTWPALQGIACSVSRPWLGSDEEADALVRMVVDAVALTRGAELELDVRLDQTPDDSLKARELSDRVGVMPRWHAGKASIALRHALAQLGGRLKLVGANCDEWLPQPLCIMPLAGRIDADEVWRYPLGEAPVLRTSMPCGATGRVRWWTLEPTHPAVDLWIGTGLGKSFSANPASRIHESRRMMMQTDDFALAAELWCPRDGGRVRIQAEVETSDGWLPTAPLDLRLSTASGFRGALSECRNMPYVFGVSRVLDGELTGADSGWGADCTNLLIHAWRRQGLPMRWGDPAQLRSQLHRIASDCRISDGIAITEIQIEDGLMVDFGNHVAAIWQDLEPVGVLGAEDLAFHHLGGVPEILSMAELCRTRPTFGLYVPQTAGVANLRVAGDVVLYGDDLEWVAGFEKQNADCFLINLEGVPTMREPLAGLRHDFRFPAERLGLLRERGVDAVSLANNHAGDAGPDGLLDALTSIRRAGLAVVGAGRNEEEACKPWRTTMRGVDVAIFGVCLVDAMEACLDQAGVAALPQHAQRIEAEMTAAIARGERIVVMTHGGDEYTELVNKDQRHWARWLTRRGASLVVGAHPHVLQREECHAGAVIVHSLGNAVYPKSLKGLDTGRVVTLPIPAQGAVGNRK